MKFSRRKFILTTLLATPFAMAGDAHLLEPQWVKTRHLRLAEGTPACRFVHFSDLHHKGDRVHTQSLVKKINSLSPDFVCFTGDLIEDTRFLPEALELLSGIKSPLYGVPGNHDFMSHASFSDIAKSFASTGGAWLVDEQKIIAGGAINLIGVANITWNHPVPVPQPGMKNILMVHYPAWAKRFGDQKYHLLLAGHSHGCQVRIPFYGPLITPYGVGDYDLGLFQTPAGPLNVTSGIGWFPLPVRFNCRPEIVVVEV